MKKILFRQSTRLWAIII